VIYAGTRRVVETIRSALARFGISTAAYHAGLEPKVRSSVQEEFLSGRTRTVAATNAFGMGVDKSDVRLVVHYRMPGTLESYYQEAGRAGRGGAAARCVAFWGRDDQRLHMTFLDRSRPPLRNLKRPARALRRTIGVGDRGLVEDARLLRAVGCGCPEEELGTLLAALERLGAVRVHHGPGEPAQRHASRVALPARVRASSTGRRSSILAFVPNARIGRVPGDSVRRASRACGRSEHTPPRRGAEDGRFSATSGTRLERAAVVTYAGTVA